MGNPDVNVYLLTWLVRPSMFSKLSFVLICQVCPVWYRNGSNCRSMGLDWL